MGDAKTWELKPGDTLSQRARKLTEIALADTFDNELKVSTMLPRAILRVQEAMEKYEALDRATKPPASRP